jgi:SNF2 family DNA or RNA helicase
VTIELTHEYHTLIGEETSIKLETESLLQKEREMIAALQALKSRRDELAQRSMRNYNRKHELQRLIAEAEKNQAEQAKLEEEKKFYLGVAERVEKICADSLAWHAAHDYQREDIIDTIAAYLKGKSGMLNANDMGLGKTFESSVTLYILSCIFEEENGAKPDILWLTKKSLMRSSPKEIQRWWPGVKVIVPEDANNVSKREFMLEMYDTIGDIFLTNYEYIRTTPKAKDHEWDLVVIDEVHKLKGGANPGGPTAIWVACKEVLIKARFMFMLSGTPMVNAPEEMWSYLHIFAPHRFPTMKAFRRDFMDYKNIAGEFKLTVDPNKILQQALKGQMIRRARNEVGLQIPSITGYGPDDRVELEMTPKQAEVYKMMRENFYIWLDAQGEKPLTAAAIIAQLTRLRQISVWPAGIKIENPETGVIQQLEVFESNKIDETIDIISQTDDQVVVFCTFNDPLYEIKRRCDGVGLSCGIISGDSKDDTGELEKRFQQNQLTVLCINSSMGEGLNLQKNPTEWPGGSSTAILLDRWWSPARNDQCIARVQRQGSEIPVFVHNLFSVDTVDYFIQDMCDAKSESFASIMDSSVIRPTSDWKSYLQGKV